MVDRQVLTEQMLEVRSAIEEDLLRLDQVDFVSVAFRQADERAVLVTLGTTRPDLVLATLLASVAPIVLRHLAEGQWRPEFQVLKGRTQLHL